MDIFPSNGPCLIWLQEMESMSRQLIVSHAGSACIPRHGPDNSITIVHAADVHMSLAPGEDKQEVYVLGRNNVESSTLPLTSRPGCRSHQWVPHHKISPCHFASWSQKEATSAISLAATHGTKMVGHEKVNLSKKHRMLETQCRFHSIKWCISNKHWQKPLGASLHRLPQH